MSDEASSSPIEPVKPIRSTESSQETSAAYGPQTDITGPRIKSESFDVPGMALSRRHWDRLKEEAREAKMGWTELWLGAAFAFFGAGAAAWIAFWALPGPESAKAHSSRLSADVQFNLRLIGVASLIIAVVCFGAWLGKRKDHNANLEQLIRNMESHEHDS
ncbi:MAG TPA: hypothetical protein VF009_02610 [Solirubrobacterales bacterium]